ncbi:MAG: IS110 family transposase [Candidatus Krumholzibacteria bacterium]|nr:IS110 family transposase [Candidatus Krumholzibacteria bacterium]
MIHVGLDMHKKFSEVAVVKSDGRIIDRRRLIHADKKGIHDYFSDLPGPVTVTMESTRNWYWLYELLEEYAEVKLANPRKVRLIAEAKVKLDKIDARTLAHLERTGFLPESYIPPREIRDKRELLRYRASVVAIRTGVKNRAHALMDKLGVIHPFSDLFRKAGRKFLASLELRPVYQRALDGYLQLIEWLDELEREATAEIAKMIKDNDDAKRLMTIPGVGVITANLLLCEIGDIARFPSAKKLCSYGSLTPGTKQSSEHIWNGPVGRKGNLYIKYAMIEAAQHATHMDPAMGAFYEKIRIGKGNAKARVAVARKLLTAVYYILKRKESYKPNSLCTIHLGKPASLPGHRCMVDRL